MNSVKFVLRNSSLWWITGFWAEQEQSKITCGECPLGVPGREESASLEELLWGRGGRDVWYWAGWASACSQPLVVGKGKNTPIRLNWGAVGLFNPAHDSVSRGFDAENVAAPSRRMSGCVKTKFEWDRVSGDRKSGRSKWTKLLSQKGWRGLWEIPLSLKLNFESHNSHLLLNLFQYLLFSLSCLAKGGVFGNRLIQVKIDMAQVSVKHLPYLYIMN